MLVWITCFCLFDYLDLDFGWVIGVCYFAVSLVCLLCFRLVVSFDRFLVDLVVYCLIIGFGVFGGF